MPEPIGRSDRVLLTAVGGVFAAALLAAAMFSRAPDETRAAQVASTYRTGPGGARAAWLLLGECGYRPERWERSPQELPHGDAAAGIVLVIAQPTEIATRAECAAIDRFVADGGRLLVAGDVDSLAPAALPESAPESDVATWVRTESARPSRRAAQIGMRAMSRWAGGGSDARVLYARDRRPAVVTYSRGRGEVVWWAGTTPLTNRGLDLPGNLELFFDTLGRPGARRVLWDEYFHGVRGSVAKYLLQTPIKWALLQLLALFAIVCLTWARRFTPMRVPAAESRASRLEFVEALGGLYAQAHAAPFAVRAIAEEIRLRLARRLGVPPTTPADRLAAAAESRLGGGGPPLAALLQRAEWAGREDARTSEREALALARELDRWDRRWQLGLDARTRGSGPRRGDS